MKKTYIVTITETLSHQIEVSAENSDAAIDKIHEAEAYHDGEIVLDADDYEGTDISVAIFDK